MGVRRGAQIAAAAVAVAAVVAGSWWYRPRRVPRAAASPARREAPSQFQGVELSEEDVDGTRWRITAREGSAWEARSTGELRGVRAVFERRGRSLQMTAGRGNVSGGEVVILSEGVRVQWDRYEATLDRVTYERGKGVVRSTDPVAFRGPGIEVTGRGLDIDVEGRRVRIPLSVQATLGPEAAP